MSIPLYTKDENQVKRFVPCPTNHKTISLTQLKLHTATKRKMSPYKEQVNTSAKL
jgi:hypothetical protein